MKETVPTKPPASLITGLVVAGTVLNIVGGMVVAALNIPLFLDMIGTFIVSVALGPWWGCLSGILTNVIFGLIKSPTWVPFALCQVAGALIAGYGAYFGWWRKWYKILVIGVIENVAISFIGAVIAVYVFGGFGGAVYDILMAGFLAITKQLMEAAFYWRLLVNTPDKVIGAFIAWLIMLRLPTRFKAYYEDRIKA